MWYVKPILIVRLPCRVFTVADQQLGGAGRHRERHTDLGRPSPLHLGKRRRHLGHRLDGVRRHQGAPQHGDIAGDSCHAVSARWRRRQVRSLQHDGKHLEPDLRKRHRSWGQRWLPLGVPAETRSRHGLARGSVDRVCCPWSSKASPCRVCKRCLCIGIHQVRLPPKVHTVRDLLLNVYWQYF